MKLITHLEKTDVLMMASALEKDTAQKMDGAKVSAAVLISITHTLTCGNMNSIKALITLWEILLNGG